MTPRPCSRSCAPHDGPSQLTAATSTDPEDHLGQGLPSRPTDPRGWAEKLPGVFTALLDTSVLWPSLQRDFLLSLAVEGLYRPVWSSAILEELEYREAQKLIRRQLATPQEAEERARHLIRQMRTHFEDAEVRGWEPLEGTFGL